MKKIVWTTAAITVMASPATANNYQFQNFSAENQALLMGIACDHARLVIAGQQTSEEATTRMRADTLLFLTRRYPKFRQLNKDQKSRIVIALTEESTRRAINFRCQGL